MSYREASKKVRHEEKAEATLKSNRDNEGKGGCVCKKQKKTTTTMMGFWHEQAAICLYLITSIQFYSWPLNL
jgi:hypothetical protein